MNVLKKSISVLVSICLFCGFAYLCFWATKNFSYYFMYDSLVQETISENVKAECLIINKE